MLVPLEMHLIVPVVQKQARDGSSIKVNYLL